MTKNNKGITMITLIVTIILMLIIAGVTINQSVKNIEARKIDSLYADLELLEDKVNTYYLNNGSLPIKEEFKGSDNFKSVRNVNDNNLYYVIDISKLEGVSLSMKLDFTGDDVYIMNEQSHTVYYPKGLTIDNETYYTLPKQYSKIEEDRNDGNSESGLAQIKLDNISVVVDGTSINSGEFVFELKDENNDVIETSTNEKDGKINFFEDRLLETGTHRFTVSQVLGNTQYMKYDDSVYTIIIKVTGPVGQENVDIKYYSKDMNELDKIEFLNEYQPPIKPTLPSVDEDGLAKEDTTITTDDPNVQIVIPEGFAPVILQTDRTDSLPGENGAVKAIMPVEDWNKISAEQINKGIVIVDHAITYTGSVPDFNEYVWVPIADSSKFARVAWNGPYYDRGYHSIGPHPLSKEPTSYQYWEETSSKEYIDMVSSVSSNKGFYIGRYESSEKDHVAVRAESKRGQEPMLGLSQGASVSAAENRDLHSHLIYGIEWDSVLQWFLNSGATIGAETGGTKTITINEIQNDSRSWGNYNSSVGGAATNSGYKQPGGTNEYWKANNIYDLAGNVREWTQEMYSTGTDCVIRGGYYDVGGLSVPVANRNYRDVSSTDVYSIGYRVSFYI